jgi:cytochrome P450
LTTTSALEDALVSEALLADPYTVYGALLRSAPVYWHEHRRQWLVTGHEEVRTAFRSPEDFSNVGWELRRFLGLPDDVRARCATLERLLGTPTVVHSDPPLHTRLRALVNRSFTPRAVESSREWLRALAAELLDRMAGREVVDLTAELAHPLPIRAIVHLFGGTEADLGLYKAVSSTRLLWQGSPAVDVELTLRYNALLEEFRDNLRRLWSQAADAGTDTLLSTLLAPDAASDGLSEDELYHACLVFLSAGHETTTSLIGSAILALIEHPEQQQLVRDDPTLVDALLEETLRWASPVQRIQRVAHRDVELGGQLIREGDLVVLVLAGGNRDPRWVSEPNRFDLTRTDGGGHLGLGHGIHFCVGAGLARRESAIAIELLLDRVESLELVADRPPRWAPSMNIRLLDALPVRVGWRPAAD